MASYLFTARSKDGELVTQDIESETLGGARYKLETRGFSDIKFHTDDATLAVNEAIREEMGGPDPRTVLTPEQQVRARQGRGILADLWNAWKMNALFWVPIAIWIGASLLQGRPYGWGDWLGFGLGALFLVYFVWLVILGIAYQRLLESSVWNREPETRRWRGFLQALRCIGHPGVPKLELDMRLAVVLARNGKVDEGRKLIAPHESRANDKPMVQARLAGFYDAYGDHEKAHALRTAAVEASKDGTAEVIDHALGLVRHLRKPGEAEESLKRIEGHEVADTAEAFLTYIGALVEIENRRWTEAVSLLRETETRLQSYANNPIVNGMFRDVWAFQAIALANLGDAASARRLARDATPLLTARKETGLLERLASALAALPK